ncbi:MAG TPA: hypothetical protein V6D43_06960 [Candidatus Sericytochromatia bacterium]
MNADGIAAHAIALRELLMEARIIVLPLGDKPANSSDVATIPHW